MRIVNMLLSKVIDISFIRWITANALLCVVLSMSLLKFQRVFALRMAYRVFILVVLIA